MLSILIIIRLLSGEILIEQIDTPGTVDQCPIAEEVIREHYSLWAEQIASISIVCGEKDE